MRYEKKPFWWKAWKKRQQEKRAEARRQERLRQRPVREPKSIREMRLKRAQERAARSAAKPFIASMIMDWLRRRSERRSAQRLTQWCEISLEQYIEGRYSAAVLLLYATVFWPKEKMKERRFCGGNIGFDLATDLDVEDPVIAAQEFVDAWRRSAQPRPEIEIES